MSIKIIGRGGGMKRRLLSVLAVLAIVISTILPSIVAYAAPWLGTWEHRIEITIDNTNVSSNLSNYPVLLSLSTSSGISHSDLTALFTEISDANRLKIAVTISDGTTECKAEIVSWDSAGNKAELWTSIPTVTTATSTIIYLYFGAAHADNAANVGDTGSVPAKAVWDSDYVEVLHMNDGADTSHIIGSKTGASYAKTGADNPIMVDGGVGKAQSLNGATSIVTLSAAASFATLGPLTLESYAKQTALKNSSYLSKDGGGGAREWKLGVEADGKLDTFLWGSDSDYLYAVGTTNVGTADFQYVASSWDGVNDVGHIALYVGGLAEALTANAKADGGYTPWDGGYAVEVGRQRASNTYCYNGLISETRISKIARSAAYVKANKSNFTDTLVSYGAIEPFFAPTVTTQAVSSVSTSSATGNGNVTSDGGAAITQRGVCWNTTGTPTTSDSKSIVTGTTGVFSASITGLFPFTTYYVRPYAINAVGTSYGSQTSFTTLSMGAGTSQFIPTLFVIVGIIILLLGIVLAVSAGAGIEVVLTCLVVGIGVILGAAILFNFASGIP